MFPVPEVQKMQEAVILIISCFLCEERYVFNSAAWNVYVQCTVVAG
jgi:hypothetical protein